MRKLGRIVAGILTLTSCMLTGCTGSVSKSQAAVAEYKSYDSNDDLMKYGQYITDRYIIGNHYWIDDEGTLWGTGENNYYQLGIENPDDIDNPTLPRITNCSVLAQIPEVFCCNRTLMRIRTTMTTAIRW